TAEFHAAPVELSDFPVADSLTDDLAGSELASAFAPAPAPADEELAARPAVVSEIEPDRTPEEGLIAPPEEEPEPPRESGPNWMLAFVCLVAGATSISEAWSLAAPALRATAS